MTTTTRHFHTTETLVALATSLGLRAVEQAGNIRIERADAPAGELAARRLYVAKQKKACTRVDVAGTGWLPELEGVRILSESEKFCKVGAQLDFTQPHDVTLAAFTRLCEMLLEDKIAKLGDKEFTKARQEARKEAATRLKEVLTSPARVAKEISEEDKKAKRAALEAVAQEMGVEVSDKVA